MYISYVPTDRMYMHMVCVSVRARVRASVCACVRACVHACVYTCVHIKHMYITYNDVYIHKWRPIQHSAQAAPCVHACVRACVRACMRPCVRPCVRPSVYI